MNDPMLGSQIAGYQVERLLGRGGMASVYFAWDTRNNRPVALKVMDERYRDTPAYVARFVQEAQTIAAWDQPNIVKVYDAGQEGGIYYYAMEVIRGLDLAQLLRQYLDARQLMPYNEVVRIGWAVANALDFAHARGIIHRDIKPSNVLISVDGRVLLSDFGLVMNVNRGTMGETFGSPAYIAPEQARSSAGAVPQSDNYALGVMLFEMLTGQVPFSDPSPAALALKHLTEEPPRPRALNPRLNPAVEAVLLRALRKQPAERYATARELMSALEHALSAELAGPEAGMPLPAAVPLEVTRPVSIPTRVDANAGAGGEAGLPRTEIRAQAYPVSPEGTQVRAYATAGSPATAAAPSYPVYPPYPEPYPAEPPRRRRGLNAWGCLGALLAIVLLAACAGGALALSQTRLSISSLPQSLAPLWTTLFPGLTAGQTATSAPSATPAHAPTLTRTATLAATATLHPSATPLPPTAPAIPLATATAAPTLAPTATPAATQAVYTFLLAQNNKQAGFILKNTGQNPAPFGALELYDTSNHLLVPASAWNIDTLKPGECVGMWVTTATPALPPGVRCTIVGTLLAVAPDQVFWTSPLEIHYNGQKVALCPPDQRQCAFDTVP